MNVKLYKKVIFSKFGRDFKGGNGLRVLCWKL